MKQKVLKLGDVRKLDLLNLSSHIADIYSKDKTKISGALFAHLAKQLLAAEVQPGGPYRDKKGKVTPKLNAAIGRLFVLMGNPLPNIDTYLSSIDPSLLTASDRTAMKQYVATRLSITSVDESTQESSRPYRLAQKTLGRTAEPVRTQALTFLKRVESADVTNEIALFAHFTAQAFDAHISSTKLDLLGEANIHGWIAYMIYDHIIDHEATTTLLPVANICMRLAIERYRNVLPANHPFQSQIIHYFDQVDAANAWELAHCRFEVSEATIHVQLLPDYQQREILAQRSLIHILGPIIVASLATPLVQQPEKMELLTHGLRQYLIARQLSDDIHDWKEDLGAGQVSAVVARLLQSYDVRQAIAYSLDELTSALEGEFLQQASRDMSETIAEHARCAVDDLLKVDCSPSSELIGLMTRLEDMAHASINQQSHFLDFQKEYQKSAPRSLKEMV